MLYYLIPIDLISSLLELFTISIIIPFMIILTNESKVKNSSYGDLIYKIFPNYDDFILFSVLFLVSTVIISSLLSVATNFKLLKSGNQIGQDTSFRQFKNFINAKYSFHSSINKSELSKILMNEVPRFTENVLLASLKLISKLIFLFLTLILLLIINPKVSFSILLVLVILYYLLFSSFRKKLLSNGSQISLSYKNLFKTINESLSGIKETKFYSLEKYYIDIFGKNKNIIASRTASSQIRSILPKIIIEGFLFTSLILIVYHLYQKDLLIDNIPSLTFFLYCGSRVMPGLQQVYHSAALIRANKESVKQIIKFQNRTLSFNDIDYNIKGVKEHFDILDVKDLNFSYEKNLVFNNISFKIKANTFVGIIGKSGSGKSTLLDCLLKLRVPDSGKILINQKEYSYENAISLFAYVPQNIYISDSNIENNILLGNIRKSPNFQQMKQSLKICGLNDFANNSSSGLKFNVGENGQNLSGGQRKRIGLARALYSKKPILVLDEVTSGLDKNTEKKILNDLKEISKDKLIILITHNIYELSYFNSVIDLDAKNRP